MNATEIVTEYYTNYDEDGRLLRRHSHTEFRNTMRFIEKYLKTGDKILEIGAATGRYSHTLARRGFEVDAIELVPHNIELFKKNTEPGEKVTITQGNAMDLSHIADNTYDITLLLGPMYHLYTHEDRLKALSEAIRVTKKGGIIYTAYCNNDTCVMNFYFGYHKCREEYFRNKCEYPSFKLGSDPSDLFVLMRKEDIDELMSHFEVERLHYVGVDMLSEAYATQLSEMEDEEFEEYERYVETICERPDMVGFSFHLLDVFKKKGE